MKEQNYLRSFGRIKSRKLSEIQNDLMQKFLPKIQPTIERINSQNIWFEIGFGAGEHLIQLIQERENQLIIGCEPYINGAVKAIKYIHDHDVRNVLISDGDARELIERLEDQSVEKFYVLFPDPWPKTKHHKRRIIQNVFLSLLMRKLRIGGCIIIATDHEKYSEWIHEKATEFNFKYTILHTIYECQQRGVLTRYCMKALAKRLCINLFEIVKN